MNGRVYDPELGKFISANPNIQFAESTQGYNRTAYVNNNPLSASDPSGYFSLKEVFRPLAAMVAAYLTYGAVSGFLTTSMGNAAGVCYASTYTPTAAVIGGSAAAGAVAGGVTTGTWKGVTQGAVSGALFGGIGAHFGNRWTVGRVASNAVAGGATSKMAGGDFEDGFRIAFVFSTARVGWDFARKQTDALKLLSAKHGGDPASYNEQGELLTDGTRKWEYGSDADGNKYTDSEHNKFTKAGMRPEGEVHIYSKYKNLARFVNLTSKVHDFMNSWGYNQTTGLWVSKGEMYNTAFQAYSMAGMVPAGAFTTIAMSAWLPTPFIQSELED